VEINDQIRLAQANETIDLRKLGSIIRTNWVWILLIIVLINSIAYLVIRYSKNLYQSSSEIKLDIKSEASELGIKTFVEDQSVNIIAGEIEIIQSKLFLNRVAETGAFDITFISVGRFLTEEVFQNPPAFVKVNNNSHHHFNQPIYYSDIDASTFTLRIGEQGQEITGKYGEPVLLDDLSVTLTKNEAFKKGDEVAYYFIVNSKDALIDYLARNLIAEPLNFNANIIGISFKDYNPFKAQAIISKVDSLYLQYSNEQKNATNKQKINWLTTELSRIEKRMEDYEGYFKQFTLENKTNNLDENLQKTIQNLNRVDSFRYDLTRRLNEIDKLISGLQLGNLQLATSLRPALPQQLNKSVDDLLLLSLELERMKLSYQEITFAYREKQKQVDVLRRKTIEQLQELRGDWARRLKELDKQIAVLEKEFESYPDKNTAFIKNQRFYKLYEEFYLSLMQSKSKFEIEQAGTTANFQILSPASLPVTPISPNRPMIAGIGLMTSIFVSLFFVGFLYILNNKITSSNELERIQSAPLLGIIPVAKYSTQGLHVLDHPKSMMSEAIRTIRTNLDFFNPKANQKIIAISSTISGEGKSFIAMNLGGIFALSKKRVVLIDLDMRKAKTNQPAENIDNTKGVSTILIRKHKWEDCIVKTPIETFDFIPSGPHPPNPSELLLNGEFNELISTLKQNYDFIILDTPPVGLVTDGIMAMRQADVCIYIFRANYSKKEYLTNLQRIISVNKFSNITTLLNSVPQNGKPYGYGYYEESKRPSKLKSLLHV